MATLYTGQWQTSSTYCKWFLDPVWQWQQLPVVQADHVVLTLLICLLGSRGRHFVCINTLNQVSFCISALQG